jgi:SDR family mycofactocin-dependent oxidoreductase
VREVGRLEGRIAFITGIGRGQGRSHAVRLAAEGAHIAGIDCVRNISSVPYDMATPDDLVETERLIKETGRQAVLIQGDVRRQSDLDGAVGEALEAFGHLDMVCANAGVSSFAPFLELSEEQWSDVIDVNLSGVWRTLKAVAPAMIAGGRGGSIVITSSIAAFKGMPTSPHYSASKAGLVGLMHSAANALAPHDIRVNTVHPTGVATPMVHNPFAYRRACPDIDDPTVEDLRDAFLGRHALSVPWIESEDVSNAVAWLVSDESRFVTGTTLVVDAGALNKG